MRKILCLSSLIAVLLVLLMFPAQAASTLTISSPSNDSVWSWDDLPTKIKWGKVTGAAGYYVTIKNDNTGEYIIQNKYTTSTSFSISDMLPDKIALYKIWVGAVKSSSVPPASASPYDIIYITVSHEPDVTIKGHSEVTASSVKLQMSVNKDYGSAITDSGFYIGTRSSVSSMTKYSFYDYGSYSATSKETKYMTISDLEPDTKYYYRAYAENKAGEEVSSYKYFTTGKKSVAETLKVNYNSLSFGWNSTSKKTVTVTCSGSYSYDISYDGVPASAMSDYNYEWLNVSKSGNSLSIGPSRWNYAKAYRTATITLKSGSLSTKIIVTHNACTESAPTLVFTDSPTSTKEVYPSGMFIDRYSSDMEVTLYLYAYMSNVRRLCINIHNADTDESIRSDVYNRSGVRENIACFTPVKYQNGTKLNAGNYVVECWASNSDVENDYWSQRCDKITFRFSIEDKEDKRYAPAKPIPSLEGLSQAEKLVAVAKSQLGYKETGNNNTVYAHDILCNDDHCKCSGQGWCAPFVSWCADKAGLIDAAIFKKGTVATPDNILNKYTAYYFRQMTTRDSKKPVTHFISKATDIIYDPTWKQCRPEEGDLIFLSWEEGVWSHVGIVYDYDGSTIYYIDGNSSTENVARKEIEKNKTAILAIARPTYVTRIHTDYEAGESIVGEVINVSIRYDANGGKNAPDEQILQQGSLFITISDKKPSRDGYNFLGWSTDTNATSAKYLPGDEISLHESVVLYAVWEKKESSGGNSKRIPGDANSDGIVDIRDFLRLAKYVAGYDITINAQNSEVTGDGIIDIRDFLRLAKYVAGYNVQLQ